MDKFSLELDFRVRREATVNNLFYYPLEELADYAKSGREIESRFHCIAELFVREFLKKGSTQKIIDSILTENELTCFWRKFGGDFLDIQSKMNLLRTPLWKPSPSNGFSGKCEIIVRNKIKSLCEKTDGFIPVYRDERAVFIPFQLKKTSDVLKQGGIVDKTGRPIQEWQAPYARLFPEGEYRCIVQCDQDGLHPLVGDSLMLPLHLAYLRKEGILDYNPLRLVATGEIDDKISQLKPVKTKEKAAGFHACFSHNSCFFFPETGDYCIPEYDNEVSLREMELTELPEIMKVHIETYGLLVPKYQYALERLKILAEDRDSNYARWDVMLKRINHNMKGIQQYLDPKNYLLCLMLKSSILCHMGKTDEAMSLNREAQDIAQKNHFTPEMLRLQVEELVELQDKDDFDAILKTAAKLEEEIQGSPVLENCVKLDLLMRFYGTMGQAHAFGDLAKAPGFSREEAKKCFEKALKSAKELSETGDIVKKTKSQRNAEESNIAQDLNYCFLWYALFEPETTEGNKAYIQAENHLNELCGSFQEKNRRFLVRIKDFSLYRAWLKNRRVPDIDFTTAEENMLIDRDKGSWLAALSGKYVGALFAASGDRETAVQIFKEYSSILKDVDDPILQFIQMTLYCEAFRSTGDEDYRQKAFDSLDQLRRNYPKSIIPWKRFLQGKVKRFPGWNYWY